jgi:hypothetical protein
LNIKTVFTIDAIILAAVGLGLLLIPATMFSMFGSSASPAAVHAARGLGSALLGLALMTWMARNTGPSKARDALVAGLVLFFIAGTAEDVRAVLTGTFNALGWVSLAVLTILTLLNGAVGRTAMSKGQD